MLTYFDISHIKKALLTWQLWNFMFNWFRNGMHITCGNILAAIEIQHRISLNTWIMPHHIWKTRLRCGGKLMINGISMKCIILLYSFETGKMPWVLICHTNIKENKSDNTRRCPIRMLPMTLIVALAQRCQALKTSDVTVTNTLRPEKLPPFSKRHFEI